MGCSVDEFKYIFDSCMSNDNIILEGIYSHLANSVGNVANNKKAAAISRNWI